MQHNWAKDALQIRVGDYVFFSTGCFIQEGVGWQL
jgi:hypothetical protein